MKTVETGKKQQREPLDSRILQLGGPRSALSLSRERTPSFDAPTGLSSASMKLHPPRQLPLNCVEMTPSDDFSRI